MDNVLRRMQIPMLEAPCGQELGGLANNTSSTQEDILANA